MCTFESFDYDKNPYVDFLQKGIIASTNTIKLLASGIAALGTGMFTPPKQDRFPHSISEE